MQSGFCSEKVLKSYFRQFGEIVSVSVVEEAGSIRKTYITYRYMDSAECVMEMCKDHDGLMVRGIELNIKHALPSKVQQPQSTLFTYILTKVKSL